jgi:hypothetical protein
MHSSTKKRITVSLQRIQLTIPTPSRHPIHPTSAAPKGLLKTYKYNKQYKIQVQSPTTPPVFHSDYALTQISYYIPNSHVGRQGVPTLQVFSYRENGATFAGGPQDITRDKWLPEDRDSNRSCWK